MPALVARLSGWMFRTRPEYGATSPRRGEVGEPPCVERGEGDLILSMELEPSPALPSLRFGAATSPYKGEVNTVDAD
jgi:hypothetical protein